MFNYFNTIFTVYDQKSAKYMQFCTKVVHGKSWRHRTRLVLHGGCKMTFSSTGSWCGNPCPICKKTKSSQTGECKKWSYQTYVAEALSEILSVWSVPLILCLWHHQHHFNLPRFNIVASRTAIDHEFMLSTYTHTVHSTRIPHFP